MEYSYFLFLLLLVPCMIFSAVASAKVSSTYSKYDKIPCLSRMTGYDTATALLRNRGVSDISVGIVKGTLTDHYDPTKSIVNLSQSTFGSASVGACAVAGHEIGHVMQKKQGYFPYKLRKILVPITNIGSRLAMPVIIVGIFLDLFLFATVSGSFTWGSRSTDSRRCLRSSPCPWNSTPRAERKICSSRTAFFPPKR